jgi:hypothetical protein
MQIKHTEELIIHAWLVEFNPSVRPDDYWERAVRTLESKVAFTDFDDSLEGYSQTGGILCRPEGPLVAEDEWWELMIPGHAITQALRQHQVTDRTDLYLLQKIEGDFASLTIPGYTYLGKFVGNPNPNFEPDEE